MRFCGQRNSSQPPSPRSSPVWLVPLVGGCLIAGCGGGDLVLPANPGPAAIAVVGGDAQQGSVGELLDSPIIIEVTDADGEPLQGVTVAFALTSAGEGAEIVPATATTDQDGRARAQVLLGSKPGLQTGEARVVVAGPNPPKASFTALAMAVTPGNDAPRADFDWHCDGLACQFTDASTDGDGSVTGWSWTFGDGDESAEREPAHTYASAGSYTVTLGVTDDGGSGDMASHQVTVAAPPPPSNDPPQADFDVDCDDLACAFTDRSDDPDGSVVSWLWDFGDGSSSAQQSPSHIYAAPGHYQVILTVTDDDGAPDTRTRDAEAQAPPPPEDNRPPHADFEVHCHKRACTFTDKSTDDDGAIVAWQWSFGDGSSSSERNPEHTYADPGRYEVSLTVTDNLGATDAKTRDADAKR